MLSDLSKANILDESADFPKPKESTMKKVQPAANTKVADDEKGSILGQIRKDIEPKDNESMMENLEEYIDFTVPMYQVTVEYHATENGKVLYLVSGYDRQGFFDGLIRRYSEFLALFEILSQRYEGLYLPYFPPKQTFGTTDSKFIENRRQLLQEFLRNLSRYSYLWQGEEFHAWVRYSQHPFRDFRNPGSTDQQFLARLNRLTVINLKLLGINKDQTMCPDMIKMLNTISKADTFCVNNITWMRELANFFKQMADKYEL